ncbi:MAG: hypothetical protein AB8B65_14505 [Kordia sp.]|uniref:hypothetical protein n=1 Tax=Kordia sp. TaxID=1965332 RepID=UPI003859B68B
MKGKNIFLLLIICLNFNCKKMETVNCFEIHTFSKVLNVVQNKGTSVFLDTKLVIQKDTKAKEYVFENFVLESIENREDMIVIIDGTKVIPTFTVSKVGTSLNFSAYASRIDSEDEKQQRKDIWCQLATKILAD